MEIQDEDVTESLETQEGCRFDGDKTEWDR